MTTPIGTLGWLDLTDENASDIRDFYQSVVGFQVESLSMGEYDDFVMKTADGKTMVAGVVHKRGSNADVPKGWIPYFVVADLAESLREVERHGGERVGAERQYGGGRFHFIKDPTGAVCAVFEEGEASNE